MQFRWTSLARTLFPIRRTGRIEEILCVEEAMTLTFGRFRRTENRNRFFIFATRGTLIGECHCSYESGMFTRSQTACRSATENFRA